MAKTPTHQSNRGRYWPEEHDKILLSMISDGKKWKEISEFFDIPMTTCLERYNRLVKKSTEWDEKMEQKLEKAYQQSRQLMWKMVGDKIGVPWRAAEDHAWDLGKKRFVKGSGK